MNYYKKSIQAQFIALRCLCVALWRTLRALFTRYPNVTWAVLCAALAIVAVMQVGDARMERDQYGHENALLQHQLDSVQGKEIKYLHVKE